jgi:uncharacterized protein (DUF1330 family)
MAHYAIIEITVHDRDTYMQYIEQVRPMVERNGGRYLARGGEVTPFVGGWKPERVILIEFPSAEAAQRCFGSAEYRAVAPLRERSTDGRAIFVAGCE